MTFLKSKSCMLCVTEYNTGAITTPVSTSKKKMLEYY